jgi:hypothetical protein
VLIRHNALAIGLDKNGTLGLFILLEVLGNFLPRLDLLTKLKSWVKIGDMSTDASLISLVLSTPFLSPGDKSFIQENLPNMTALEKLKLKQSLLTWQAPAILEQLQIIRAKFYEKEIPKKPDPITQVVHNIFPPKPKKVLSVSVMNQPGYLGAPIPQPARDQAPPMYTLTEYNHPAQLATLHSQLISFNLNDNSEQIMQNFLQSLSASFDKIDNIQVRRGYFMSYMRSPLFSAYLNTGMTALRHPELEPAKIILNLLYQIDSKYLNNKQFKYVAMITNHLRNLCAV